VPANWRDVGVYIEPFADPAERDAVWRAFVDVVARGAPGTVEVKERGVVSWMARASYTCGAQPAAANLQRGPLRSCLDRGIGVDGLEGPARRRLAERILGASGLDPARVRRAVAAMYPDEGTPGLEAFLEVLAVATYAQPLVLTLRNVDADPTARPWIAEAIRAGRGAVLFVCVASD
jgi:hypothetical protein